MGYEELWKILDNLVVEFRKRGEDIPINVIEDLRAAKTMIQVLKADPKRTENVPTIEMYMDNVESFLVFVGQKKFGAEFAEEWMQKIREARLAVYTSKEEKTLEPTSKFVSGAPRDQRWLRVQVSAETPESEIRRLASDCGLSAKVQADGYVLVFGDDKKLKLFIQKAGEKLRREKVP